MHLARTLRALLLLACALTLPTAPARAYSVLTHEQLIDLTWKQSIVPLLLSRYPNLTPAQLEEARAYAYGGCVIQDIGYYPFGDTFFSDLTHYVRSGDFVVNLFRDAHNANELAFAVGALSHYIGDTVGHAEATNRAVPIEFPKLAARYGPVVNYAQGEHQHVQTEFAFDINEIAHHRMAPVHYLRHVGLKVPTQQVSDAFYQTYGLGEDFSGRRGARVNVRGYRFAVHSFLPRIAYAVNLLHRRHEPADPDTPDMALLNKEVARVSTEDDWPLFRRNPGIGTYTLAWFIYILPKLGPLKLVSIKGPSAATEEDYVHSVISSTASLRRVLARFTPPPTQQAPGLAPAMPSNAAAAIPISAVPQTTFSVASAPKPTNDPNHPLPNLDLDTGIPVHPGGYPLTDSTYAGLLHRLAKTPKAPVPPTIRASILAYYADPAAPISTRNNPRQWAEVQADLKTLATMPIAGEPALFQTYETPDTTN